MALRAYTRSFERRPYLTLLVTNATLMSLGDFTAQNLGNILSAGAPEVYDLARTFRFAFFGASMGPIAGVWNRWLEVTFPLRPYTGPGPVRMTKVQVEKNTVASSSRALTGGGGGKSEKSQGGFKGGGGAPGDLSGEDKGREKDREYKQPDVSVAALAKRVAADQLGMAPVSLILFLCSMGFMEGLDGEGISRKLRDNYLPILLVNWQVWPLLQLINFRYIPLKYRVPFGSIAGIAWTCFLSFRTNSLEATV